MTSTAITQTHATGQLGNSTIMAAILGVQEGHESISVADVKRMLAESLRASSLEELARRFGPHRVNQLVDGETSQVSLAVLQAAFDTLGVNPIARKQQPSKTQAEKQREAAGPRSASVIENHTPPTSVHREANISKTQKRALPDAELVKIRRNKVARSERVPATANVALWVNDEVHDGEARTANISEDGMFVVTTKPLPVGTRARFTVSLPTGDYVHGYCEVVWIRPHWKDAKRPNGMGIRYVAIRDRGREQLRSFMLSSLATRLNATAIVARNAVA